MRANRGVLAAWAAVIALFVTGIAMGSVGLVVLAHLAAIVVAAIAVSRAELIGELRYPRAYRVALGLLAAAAATVLFSAGSTVFITTPSGERMIGFVVLASANLILAVVTWRALTRPAPRRAALVGLLAVVVELVATLTDIFLTLRDPPNVATTQNMIALWAAFAATWLGALVSVAALATFERAGNPLVPSARVVD